MIEASVEDNNRGDIVEYDENIDNGGSKDNERLKSRT